MCFWDYLENKTIDKWVERVCITCMVIQFPFAADDVLIIIPSNTHRQNPNISRTLVGNAIVDHSDVLGASPVGAVPTTYLFST